MPLFQIARSLAELPDEEVDAGALRAEACLTRFPGMRWTRSYYDAAARLVTSYYEAESQEQIREHARAAQIPCDAVIEVTELVPDSYR
ncbi:MAG TPA: nickel-binding protein [Dehalococcoidia bacterium]|nr:nickel-binding protein [Dehalococcoidia bacterium]